VKGYVWHECNRSCVSSCGVAANLWRTACFCTAYYLHTHTHTHTHTHPRTHTHTHTHPHTQTPKHPHTHIPTYPHTHTLTHPHTARECEKGRRGELERERVQEWGDRMKGRRHVCVRARSLKRDGA
jgi:hypothetical protein